ncbi:P25 protein [Zancudomyces culisetae]|uniref:p25 protein n=1 Tax=Zancudomyces culisetae TaxID=1213189 RepID=A0A1R1PZN3_ZANCU|nr:P25 protein [Zancudomyces culisetae]|eukprot:OMH86400.1 P25 protein [Zancudomyces culisetae]
MVFCCGLGKSSKKSITSGKAVENKTAGSIKSKKSFKGLAEKKRPTIHVVYYSTYGHIAGLAKEIVKALQSTNLVDVKLFQFPETLSSEILQKMHAPPKDESVPVYTVDAMREADAYMFGSPTRFGTLPGQVKTFIDSLGSLWVSGALVGKMYGVFFGTGSQGGGMETTALSFVINATHLGMIYVPLGPNKAVATYAKTVGGSAYGPGVLAGLDGSKPANEEENESARKYAEYFSKVVVRYNQE